MEDALNLQTFLMALLVLGFGFLLYAAKEIIDFLKDWLKHYLLLQREKFKQQRLDKGIEEGVNAANQEAKITSKDKTTPNLSEDDLKAIAIDHINSVAGDIEIDPDILNKKIEAQVFKSNQPTATNIQVEPPANIEITQQ